MSTAGSPSPVSEGAFDFTVDRTHVHVHVRKMWLVALILGLPTGGAFAGKGLDMALPGVFSEVCASVTAKELEVLQDELDTSIASAQDIRTKLLDAREDLEEKEEDLRKLDRQNLRLEVKLQALEQSTETLLFLIQSRGR